MTDAKPLLTVLIVMFMIGAFVPLIVTGFSEVSSTTYNHDSFISPFIGFVQNGMCFQLLLWEPCINPWAGLPALQSFTVEQLSAFSYIPNIIAIPVLILFAVALFYALIKLLPTT